MSTTMLYRPASEPNPACWGLNVEHQVFADAEVVEALGEGWFRHPVEFPAEQAPPPPKEG